MEREHKKSTRNKQKMKDSTETQFPIVFARVLRVCNSVCVFGVYIDIYTSMYVYTYIDTDMCIYMYIHVYMYMYMYVCVYMNPYICI